MYTVLSLSWERGLPCSNEEVEFKNQLCDAHANSMIRQSHLARSECLRDPPRPEVAWPGSNGARFEKDSRLTLLFSTLRPHTHPTNMWHEQYFCQPACTCVHEQWHMLELLYCNCTIFCLLSTEIRGYKEHDRHTGMYQKSINTAQLENSFIKFTTQVSIHYSKKPPQAFVSGENGFSCN